MKKPSTSGRPSIYQTVTDRIISNLKAGMIPWEKPWKTPRYSGGPFPRNFYIGKPYRGINVLLLWSSEYISPFWLTFKQAQALKGTVRKGEHGTPIIFYKQLPEHATKDEKAPGEDERVPFVLCHYTVFVLLCLPVDRFCFAGEKQKNPTGQTEVKTMEYQSNNNSNRVSSVEQSLPVNRILHGDCIDVMHSHRHPTLISSALTRLP